MQTFKYKDKSYDVDDQGFLVEFEHWDSDFAEGMAPRVKIHNGLGEKHWQVIHFIRDTFKESGTCPLIYQTCRSNGLRLTDFRELFPAGHLRGACKLAGLTYKEGFLGRKWLATVEGDMSGSDDKLYEVDVRGFLVDPYFWDENYALHKAYEMKMEELSDKHWRIIHYLRDSFKQNYTVPTVFETCEANNISLDEMEKLFPDGYHRGAVKLAGLRVR
jgi:TusE/DsrC/DsvC family sulfur relay protein